jgi:SAM-dependent methyltransferase
MTHAEHSPHHSHPDRPGHGPAHEHTAELAEILDLDAALGAGVLSQAMDAAVHALDAEPSVIVDLGAGTGTGTLALAERFPGSRVHSIDASAGMLARLRDAATAAGVAGRVDAHLVDLDGDWPAAVPTPVDLAWAALSLHHVSDPGRVLRQAFDALRPGGVAHIVIEMTGATRYEPTDLGAHRPGLGERIVDTLAAHGYPVTADWTEALASAGFEPVSRVETELAVSAGTTDGARYLGLQFALNRALLAQDLGADDLAALDTVIAALAGGESNVTLASGRVVWTAVRPAAGE